MAGSGEDKRAVDYHWLNRLRWKLTIKFMKWAVRVAPPGDAAVALHEHHLMWCDYCRHQWNLRYGDHAPEV